MNVAESKVNHSAASSSVLCCRLLLVFLPLPPPLGGAGFWWAVVNKHAQPIAKIDFCHLCRKFAFLKRYAFFYDLLLQRSICSLTQGLAVSDLDISWLWWWGSLQITVTSTPTGWSEGQRESSVLYVSKTMTAVDKKSTSIRWQMYLWLCTCPYVPSIPICHQSESSMESVFSLLMGKERGLLVSWTPGVEDRNGETFLLAGICGWKTT